MRLKHPVMFTSYAIGVAVALLLAFVPEASAFNDPDLLNMQIKATNIKGHSISQVLEGLADEYGIPLGIELSDENFTPDREINLNLPVTNLKGFLDSLIAKDPRYAWKLEGGVIHVWPVSDRDAFLASLLDTRISHFAIIGDVYRKAIYHDIMNLPEIRSKLVVAGVAPLTFFEGLGPAPKLAKEAFFSESNITLRELLDRIVLKTEIRQWIIGRWGKNSEYISLKG